jgi:membrane protease YdiL (CAAX protease family)
MSDAIPSSPKAEPFLACTGPRDRNVLATAAFVLAGGAAALVGAILTGLLVTTVFAAAGSGASGRGLVEGLSRLTQSPRPNRSLLSYGYELSVAGLASFAAAAVALALAAWIFRRPVRSFLTAAPRFRWRAVAGGFLVGFPLVGLAFAAERLLDPSPIASPILGPEPVIAKLGYAAIAAGCLYLAAFAEEAIFRGWLLQQTGAWTRSLGIILAVNGVLFSLAHFDPSPVSFAVRAVMGAGWAWLALRTAGVEFTTGAHLANNLFVALFVAPVSFAPPKAGHGGYAPALIELAIVLAMVGAVELWLRRGTAPAPGDTF